MSFTRRSFLAAAAPLALSAAAPKGGAGDRRPLFIVAALAPLDRTRRIDEGLTKEYLAYLRDNGVDGVLVNGSTGEFASFSTEERKRNLEVFLKHKGSLAMMCQVGSSNQPEALELTRHAQGAGADQLLLLPPFYFSQPSDDGLAAFMEPILDASELPVLLYNIPQLSGVQITLGLVRKLSGHPRLFGVKDSWGKLDNTLGYIHEKADLHVFTGASAQIQVVLEAGGAGALTGNGNVFPAETAAIVKAFRERGDVAAAQKKLDERAAILKGYAAAESQKACLEAKGLGRMYVRPPFVDLTDAQRADLKEKMRAVGALS
ncbi:MAG: hypothetical protein GC160_08410 [Acidobacteria bacterium]|nr:hypothetical protein [Acidobacteriota bacterium]